MAYLSVKNVSIKGLACAVPKGVKKVSEQPFFSEVEANNFTQVTGVTSSHIVDKGTTCSDLCQKAAEQVLDKIKWDRDTIDMIIFVSVSRDYYICPNTSNILQHKLGLSEECIAIDLPFACSGYVYGLSVASSMMSSGQIKRTLLLVGETTSMNQSSLDKTVWPLHGDAGSATLLEYDEDAKDMQFHLCGDGAGEEAIVCKECGTRYPMNENSLKKKEYEEGIVRAPWQANMNGMSVFSFAITKPGKCIKGLAEHFSFDITDIDFLLLHQANRMIDEKLRKKLKLSEEQVPYSMMTFGNTSSCTIPITAVSRISHELSTKENNLVLCGFGSGLSWGAAHIYTNKIECLSIIEV